MEKAISVEQLTICYKDFTAVDNISFDVEVGEIFGVIGPNGAGKTSTIECIEGLRKPTSGKISVLGIAPSNRRSLYNAIGVQLQEASFADGIKVGEVCRLFSSFYPNPVDYHELLARFNLADKEKVSVKKLSGGQRQKLSIIAALVGNPKVLFLDELTTGLDPQARIGMWELIKDLREEGKTIFMTTHFMEEAEYLCDRVCMMVKGKIAVMGSVEELIALAEIGQKIVFVSKNPRIDLLQVVSGVEKATEHRGKVELWGKGENLMRDVMLCITENNIPFEDFKSTNPGLEDVFLKLTGSRLEVKE